MLKRRALLMTMAAAGLVPGVTRRARAEPAPTGQSAALKALFDRFVQESLQRSPELATGLGLDKGKLAPLKSRLSDASLAASAQDKITNAEHLAALRAIDRASLHGIDVANYDTVLFTLQVAADGQNAFDYAGGDLHSPYVISQLVGSYHDVPDFLDTQHDISTAADAEAYISRLDALAVVMGQELEQAEHDAKLGVVPPDFVIDKTLLQMKNFLDTPADKALLVTSLVRRAAEAGLKDDYKTRAAAIYTTKIIPALQRQADHFTALRPTAVHDAGIARLPKGPEYYTLALKTYTTSSMSPSTIHETGLKLVSELTAGLDTALRAQGFSTGTVGQRLAALAADPKFLYPNTDEGKETLIADLNKKVTVVQAKLPQYFGALPKAGVEIHRVPKATEAGAPGGYYQPGSLDGSRKGVYWINLRDTAEVPRWALPTLTYHESIPGHHLQLTLAQETPGLPLIRKIVFFSGYGEGWALYAEQLAVEMGMYDDDPLGHIGQMQAALFRAVRLVVDSGLHAQGWSREKAVDYFVDVLGEKRTSAVTEVERYCVWPGQACSYMVGKLTWLRVRDQAKTALGPKFDLHKFHDAGLLSGALPLDVLETVIGNYVTVTKA
jgi:uncharacterized protein (DUF885 family)